MELPCEPRDGGTRLKPALETSSYRRKTENDELVYGTIKIIDFQFIFHSLRVVLAKPKMSQSLPRPQNRMHSLRRVQQNHLPMLKNIK